MEFVEKIVLLLLLYLLPACIIAIPIAYIGWRYYRITSYKKHIHYLAKHEEKQTFFDRHMLGLGVLDGIAIRTSVDVLPDKFVTFMFRASGAAFICTAIGIIITAFILGIV